MARPKNDGRGRLGGRQKGTPNKASADLKAWICKVIDDNAETFQEDLSLLEPKDRVKTITSLFAYIIPKQQNISVEELKKAEFKELGNLMQTAPDEALSKIAEKLKTDLENDN